MNPENVIVWIHVRGGLEERQMDSILYRNLIFLPHYRFWKIQVERSGRKVG